MNKSKLWTISVIVLFVLFAYKLNTGIVFESNILALLPTTETEPSVQKALDRFNTHIGHKVIFLVGNTHKKIAHDAANTLYQKLRISPFFKDIQYRLDDTAQKQVFSSYLPYRHMLLSQRHQEQLEQGKFEEILNNALNHLYTPMTQFSAQDPLFLFSDYFKERLSSVGALNIEAGIISVQKNGKHYVLITALLDFEPFSAQQQSLFSTFYTDVKQSLHKQYPSVVILSAGVIHHAIAGTQSAQQEISTIGVGSLIGIVLLILIAFKSLRPLWFSLVPIAVGLLAGLMACVLFFKEIHLITLVFGASLIGVSIDYCFHYFADQYDGGRDWDAHKGLQRIFPGITLGLMTSIIGYLALFITPFPGLQQIALFSAVGLLASYLSVICWFPYWLSATDHQMLPILNRISVGLFNLWHLKKIPFLSIIVLIIGLVIGCLHVQINDDIRILQSSPIELIAQEEKIKDIFERHGSQQFFLITAETAQAVLEKEEALGQLLRIKMTEGALDSYQAISQVLPSASLQQKNYDSMRHALIEHRSRVLSYFEAIGFEGEKYLEAFNQALSMPPLTMIEGLQSPAIAAQRFLWLGKIDNTYASIMTLNQIRNIATLERLEAEMTGITFINHVDDISQLLKRYRIEASYLVIMAYIVIFILLMIRYPFFKACLIIIPPLLAATGAVAFSAWLGVPLNLFNTMALLLVLGIGIDYSLFFAEMPQHSTMLAIMLSALTTILSFGLLALSQTPVIHSFGLMVLVGMSMAFLCAPIVLLRK
ncbi:MAG: hypothetical protein KAH77_09595 [Thiomargarita sp.]|nr:hypothetical protein [Thiomargarita sp.]